jgi:hypothetical protein
MGTDDSHQIPTSSNTQLPKEQIELVAHLGSFARSSGSDRRRREEDCSWLSTSQAAVVLIVHEVRIFRRGCMGFHWIPNGAHGEQVKEHDGAYCGGGGAPPVPEILSFSRIFSFL